VRNNVVTAIYFEQLFRQSHAEPIFYFFLVRLVECFDSAVSEPENRKNPLEEQWNLLSRPRDVRKTNWDQVPEFGVLKP